MSVVYTAILVVGKQFKNIYEAIGWCKGQGVLLTDVDICDEDQLIDLLPEGISGCTENYMTGEGFVIGVYIYTGESVENLRVQIKDARNFWVNLFTEAPDVVSFVQVS